MSQTITVERPERFGEGFLDLSAILEVGGGYRDGQVVSVAPGVEREDPTEAGGPVEDAVRVPLWRVRSWRGAGILRGETATGGVLDLTRLGERMGGYRHGQRITTDPDVERIEPKGARLQNPIRVDPGRMAAWLRADRVSDFQEVGAAAEPQAPQDDPEPSGVAVDLEAEKSGDVDQGDDQGDDQAEGSEGGDDG